MNPLGCVCVSGCECVRENQQSSAISGQWSDDKIGWYVTDDQQLSIMSLQWRPLYYIIIGICLGAN